METYNLAELIKQGKGERSPINSKTYTDNLVKVSINEITNLHPRKEWFNWLVSAPQTALKRPHNQKSGSTFDYSGNQF